MQYIGLKDKDGKEIYEGDIVKSTYEFEDGSGVDVHVGKIEYNNLSCDHYCHSIANEISRGFSKNRIYEVIGNIYEHPNLLQS